MKQDWLSAVTNTSVASEIEDFADNVGRVCIIGMFDSNGLVDDNGLIRAYSQAVSSHRVAVAMPMMSAYQLVGLDFGGGFYNRRYGGGNPVAPAVRLSDASVPAAFKKHNVIPVAWGIHGDAACYIPAGGSCFDNSLKNLIFGHRQFSLGINTRLCEHYLIATTQAGTSDATHGRAQAAVYYGSFGLFDGGTVSPQQTLAATPENIDSIDNANPDGTLKFVITNNSLNTVADRMSTPAGKTIMAMGPNMTAQTYGPFCGLYKFLTALDRPLGVSFDSFINQGGKSRKDMADLLLDTTNMDVTGETYLRGILQKFHTSAGGNMNGMIVIDIVSRYNDFSGSNTANSRGPSPAASNTPSGYTDNAKAIRSWWIARLTNALAADGRFAAGAIKLRFRLINEWRVSDSPNNNPTVYVTDADYEGWGNLGAESDRGFVNSTTDCCHIDLARLATFAELNSAGLLRITDSDSRHMMSAGYNTILGRMFRVLDVVSGGSRTSRLQKTRFS